MLTCIYLLFHDTLTEHLMDLIHDIQQQSASSAEHRRLTETSSMKFLRNEMSRLEDENPDLREKFTTETDMRLAGGDASAAQHSVHSHCDMV